MKQTVSLIALLAASCLMTNAAYAQLPGSVKAPVNLNNHINEKTGGKLPVGNTEVLPPEVKNVPESIEKSDEPDEQTPDTTVDKESVEKEPADK